MMWITALVSVTVAAAGVIGRRFSKRRRAEKLRRRGYKEYNRGRPKLLLDQSGGASTPQP